MRAVEWISLRDLEKAKPSLVTTLAMSLVEQYRRWLRGKGEDIGMNVEELLLRRLEDKIRSQLGGGAIVVVKATYKDLNRVVDEIARSDV